MKQGFRQSMAGLHSWSGLILGWLLFAIVLSGTATVFRSEISGWMRPEIARTAPPDAAIEAAVRWLGEHHPKAAGWYLTAPDERIATTQAVFGRSRRTARLSRHRTRSRQRAAPMSRATLGGEFLYRFHFELQLPYPWGRFLAVAAAMMMLIAIVSGIIIHKRIFKDIFTFRAGKGKRSWLDAHNVLGVLALPFHLMITATGIVTLLTLVMPWGYDGELWRRPRNRLCRSRAGAGEPRGGRPACTARADRTDARRGGAGIRRRRPDRARQHRQSGRRASRS